MTLPSESQTGSHDDKDISTLLKQQTIRVPDSLDESILAASKSDTSIANYKRRLLRQSPWMAVAATVVLAILVAPLMLKTPETLLEAEHSKVQLEERTRAVNSVQAETEAAVAMDVDIMQSRKASSKPAPRALISNDSTATYSMETDLSDETFAYRDTPEEWVEEINRLITEGELSSAEEEYDLFRAIHPTYETTIRLPDQKDR